jgi:hypothetical protein
MAGRGTSQYNIGKRQADHGLYTEVKAYGSVLFGLVLSLWCYSIP